MGTLVFAGQLIPFGGEAASISEHVRGINGDFFKESDLGFEFRLLLFGVQQELFLGFTNNLMSGIWPRATMSKAFWMVSLACCCRLWSLVS